MYCTCTCTFFIVYSLDLNVTSTMQDNMREYTCTMTFPSGVEASAVGNTCTAMYEVVSK